MTRTPRTLRKKKLFLKELERSGNVGAACKLAGLGRRTVYDHRSSDPEFAAAWDEVFDAFVDQAEAELRRRGVEGYEEPVVHLGRFSYEEGPNGERVPVTVRKYSEAALIFYLKGRRREVFGERVQQEISAPGGGPMQIQNILPDISNLSPQEKLALANLIDKARGA